MFKIPLTKGSQRFSVGLYGKLYHFSIIWRGIWLLDIFDQNEKPLVCGISMVPNTRLLQQHQHIFDGDLILEETADHEYLTYESMGNTLNLYYMEE